PQSFPVQANRIAFRKTRWLGRPRCQTSSGMSCARRNLSHRKLLYRWITNKEARMSSTKVTVSISVPPNELWQLIGGFGSLPDWVPDVSQSELADGGRIRHLHDRQGHTFVEKLERYDSAARMYSYSIVQSPVSISDYVSTIAVTPIEGGKKSRVEWSSVYKPVGISEKEADKIFQGLYLTGLKSLVSRYAGNAE